MTMQARQRTDPADVYVTRQTQSWQTLTSCQTRDTADTVLGCATYTEILQMLIPSIKPKTQSWGLYTIH